MSQGCCFKVFGQPPPERQNQTEEGDMEGIHFHRFFSLKKWQKKEENGSDKRKERYNYLRNR